MPCTVKYGGLNGMAEIVGKPVSTEGTSGAHSPKRGVPDSENNLLLPLPTEKSNNSAAYAFKRKKMESLGHPRMSPAFFA
jgi:hypothetical protein